MPKVEKCEAESALPPSEAYYHPIHTREGFALSVPKSEAADMLFLLDLREIQCMIQYIHCTLPHIIHSLKLLSDNLEVIGKYLDPALFDIFKVTLQHPS